MTRMIVMVINPGLQITPQTLPPAAENQPYSITLRVLFGELPIKITIVSGVLPDGLTLVDNGDGTATISGIPTETGGFDIEVEYEDVREDPRMQPYVVRVSDVPAPSAPIIVSGTAPAGTVGVVYSYMFTASGGNGGPYTWSVSSGSLPPGLTLDTVTGTVSGTPTTAVGSPFAFTVAASDGINPAGQSASQSVVIVKIYDFELVQWTGNGLGARAIPTQVDLSAGGAWWEFMSTDPKLVQSVDGTTWYDYDPGSVNNPTTGVYTFSGGAMTVPTTRNQTGIVYTAWVFRKTPGICDVMFYTGTGANGSFAHALGVAPCFLLTKKTGGAGTVQTAYAQVMGSNVQSRFAVANNTINNAATYWNSALATSSVFTLGSSNVMNQAAGTYIVVMFGAASNLASGNFTGNGGSSPISIAGFEAETVLIKSAAVARDWQFFDVARTPGFSGADQPSTFIAFGTAYNAITHSGGSTNVDSTSAIINTTGETYTYLAIKS